MTWTIGEARKRFSELIRQAEKAPQFVYRRGKVAAVLLDPQQYRDLDKGRKAVEGKSVAEAFAEYRAIAAEEDYRLALPKGRGRIRHWRR